MFNIPLESVVTHFVDSLQEIPGYRWAAGFAEASPSILALTIVAQVLVLAWLVSRRR